MYLTILVTILISIFLSLTESWQVETGNSIVNAIFGGVSVGLGIGNYSCRRYNSRYNNFSEIATKYLDVSTPYALLFFDMIVVAISLQLFHLIKF